MQVMIPMLESWCREAATLFGDDWPKVEGYIAAKLAALNDSDRAILAKEAATVFAQEAGSIQSSH